MNNRVSATTRGMKMIKIVLTKDVVEKLNRKEKVVYKVSLAEVEIQNQSKIRG